MNDLSEATNKLAYILHVKQTTPQTPENSHKNALLTYYIHQIQCSINELTQQIDDIYHTVNEHEFDNHQSYESLYDKTVQSNQSQTNFMRTFGPYMMLWQSYESSSV
jgi:hypothetical protein